ncbi:zinc-dependent peptidase [Haliea sp. E1-2-M8]|uniref:M90 family metallopeptidase n=1 Tax=Haliea sp. E1-2-M8 TaxID=3064706 RepID=UPI00271F58EE|nr:M90 family metallopeptidase [Haliea sp. E1-2-M8]MDO8861982.1 zinc-dependent peptidase [Haliea sp. E1-2-M8]
MSLLAALLIVALATLLLFVLPARRRRRALAAPFPAAWDALLARRLEPYAGLEKAERRQLQDLVRLFLADKQFHGCGGLDVTEEMRVLIAAQACLLLLNRSSRIFPGLQHILVYPGAFVREGEEWHEDGTVSEVSSELLGESWDAGKVILSWEDVDRDLDHFGDGFNVVLHEFAHQLDSESGSENGTPVLSASDSDEWVRVMTREYEGLATAAEREEETLLDPYGASAPAEFFAVITETFFELPDQLSAQHPELFSLLRRYYRVDPAQWYRAPEDKLQ